MNARALKYWIGILLFAGALYGSSVGWRMYQAQSDTHTSDDARQAFLAEKPVPEFTLTDQHGESFAAASLRGHVWVASFFFTNCPGACWKLNETLSHLQEETVGSDVRFVSITCDPDNDTPEALDRYAQHFKADPARWTFLTGNLGEIRRIANDFLGLAVERASHSSMAIVFDGHGKIQGSLRLDDPNDVKRLKKLVEKLSPGTGAAGA